MTINQTKSLKIAILSTFLMFEAAAAHAQKVEVGSNVSVNVGKDVKAAHASQGKVGVNNGNLDASGGVADGVRVGDSKFQSSVHGSVSLPAGFVAGALD